MILALILGYIFIKEIVAQHWTTLIKFFRAHTQAVLYETKLYWFVVWTINQNYFVSIIIIKLRDLLITRITML